MPNTSSRGWPARCRFECVTAALAAVVVAVVACAPSAANAPSVANTPSSPSAASASAGAPTSNPNSDPARATAVRSSAHASSERPTAPSGFTALAVPEFLPALLWTPPPRSRPYPLLVVTHGAGGTPEAHCEMWQQRLGARAYILCIRGKAIVTGRDGAFYYPNHHALDAEVMAALDVLRARTGRSLDAERIVYAGYSQGATMGALMVRSHAGLFPRLVLVEGGFREWTLGVARAYRRGGGERVLFVCGTRGCAGKARRSAGWLKRAGVEAKVEVAPGAGHTYGDAVADAVDRHLEWVVEGDGRWSVSKPAPRHRR